LSYRIDFPPEFINPQQQNPKIQKRPIDISLSIITQAGGSMENINSNAIKVVSNAFETIYQVKAVHFFASGFTDAGHLREVGIKNVVVFGPMGGAAHSSNEYVEIHDLINATKVYLLTAKRFLTENKMN
jgi:acetylornithine deacetylase/succinyl-diaminopimelate desuccinylase-like protein